MGHIDRHFDYTVVIVLTVSVRDVQMVEVGFGQLLRIHQAVVGIDRFGDKADEGDGGEADGCGGDCCFSGGDCGGDGGGKLLRFKDDGGRPQLAMEIEVLENALSRAASQAFRDAWLPVVSSSRTRDVFAKPLSDGRFNLILGRQCVVGGAQADIGDANQLATISNPRVMRV